MRGNPFSSGDFKSLVSGLLCSYQVEKFPAQGDGLHSGGYNAGLSYLFSELGVVNGVYGLAGASMERQEAALGASWGAKEP